MNKIVIEIAGGVVNAVHSDIETELEVEIVDTDDLAEKLGDDDLINQNIANLKKTCIKFTKSNADTLDE